MNRVLLILSLSILLSCEREAKPIVVTHKLIRQVDTTFQKQYKDSLSAELDTLCIDNYAEVYDRLRDSLMREELKKIESLFE